MRRLRRARGGGARLLRRRDRVLGLPAAGRLLEAAGELSGILALLPCRLVGLLACWLLVGPRSDERLTRRGAQDEDAQRKYGELLNRTLGGEDEAGASCARALRRVSCMQAFRACELGTPERLCHDSCTSVRARLQGGAGATGA